MQWISTYHFSLPWVENGQINHTGSIDASQIAKKVKRISEEFSAGQEFRIQSEFSLLLIQSYYLVSQQWHQWSTKSSQNSSLKWYSKHIRDDEMDKFLIGKSKQTYADQTISSNFKIEIL